MRNIGVYRDNCFLGPLFLRSVHACTTVLKYYTPPGNVLCSWRQPNYKTLSSNDVFMFIATGNPCFVLGLAHGAELTLQHL